MTYRVIQWATGNVGRASLRTVLDRPSLHLVGVFVTNPAKVGVDAAEIVGGERVTTGVRATNDVATVLATPADVVLHMPLPSLVHGDDPTRDLNDICALLASGKNVITTVGYMYPQIYGDAVMSRLESACAQGGSTFHGTGANPGWFGDVLPLTMAGLSLRVDRVDVREISNFQHYPSPEIMFDMMGFGHTPESFAERAARHRVWLDGLFTEAVTMVAHGLGADVDPAFDVTSEMSTWIADRSFTTAAGVVNEGTIAGQRWHWVALVDGRPFVTQETVWRMHKDAAPEWPVGDWSVTIEGLPKMHVSLPHGWNRDVLGSTAAHALNAIPYVAAAPPGVATFLTLPIICFPRGSAPSTPKN